MQNDVPERKTTSRPELSWPSQGLLVVSTSIQGKMEKAYKRKLSSRETIKTINKNRKMAKLGRGSEWVGTVFFKPK